MNTRALILLIAVMAPVAGMRDAQAEDQQPIVIAQMVEMPQLEIHQQPIKSPESKAPIPVLRPRELNSSEEQQLSRLEQGYEQGDMSESQYNQIKRGLRRATTVGGKLDDDGILNQAFAF